MKLFKKLIAILLVASIILSFAACGKRGSDTNDNVPVIDTYAVRIVNAFGMPIPGVKVLVHADGTSDYNVCCPPVTTDSNGYASFNLDSSADYSVELMAYSNAYVAKSGANRSERYTLDSEDTLIVLEHNPSYSPQKYDLGDPIANLSITDLDGNAYMIHDLLAEKKAVVLNFWFYSCGPCQSEFPALNTAYNTYKSDVELFAVNDIDSTSKIMSYAKDKGLTLDMHLVKGGAGLSDLSLRKFDSAAYPTTVVIDRYGIVSFVHVGSVPSVADWNKLFAFFTADDYTHTIVSDFKDIP